VTFDWTTLAVLGVIIAVFAALFAILTIIIHRTFKVRTTRAAASIIGIIAGLAGAYHGFGEILQGNIAPSGIVIQAWPALADLAGEPAMTIVPSFLVTGVLAIIFGLIVTVWAAAFVQSKNGGLVLILLSVVLLLVGGGLFPPGFGVTAGIIGIWIKHSPDSKIERKDGPRESKPYWSSAGVNSPFAIKDHPSERIRCRVS